MRKCAKADLNKVLAAVAAAQTLYLPVDTDNGAEYKAWSEGVTYSQALNTNRSAKDFFFPQTQDLVKFKTEGKTIEIIDIRKAGEDFVLFGVRGCDVKSIEVLDRVFLNEPVDSYYAERRAHATVVSMACTRPVETCFCGTFGIDAAAPEGDVVCHMTEDAVYFDAKTEKGEAFMNLIEGLTEDCDSKAVEEQQAKTREILKKLPLSDLTTEGFDPEKTMELFDRPEWATLSEACLGCGTCTFVCPTCQCYDIKDFNNGREITRFRCWDSCMYSDFTMMSAGQPRLTQKERFRQRFMHKLVYYPANNDGMCSCVGCGRCLAKCPISMNIAKVMKTIGGKQA